MHPYKLVTIQKLNPQDHFKCKKFAKTVLPKFEREEMVSHSLLIIDEVYFISVLQRQNPDMSDFLNLWEIKFKGSHSCQNHIIG